MLHKILSMNRFIIMLLIMVASTSVNAAWYKVEMVVFEHLYPDTGGEQWLGKQGLPDTLGSEELVESGPDPFPYQIVARGFYQLGGVFNVLKSSREYRPVYHIAWQQPGLGQSNARYVHIRYPELPKRGPDEARVADAGDNSIPPLLDGVVRLRVGHLLHIDVDLAYYFDTAADAVTVNRNEYGVTDAYQVNYTRLKESRRLKLNELHYFDHPLFGVIVRVSRIESN